MRMRTRAALAGMALLIVGAAPPPPAISSCSGTYSAALLRPLPAPLVVGLVASDDSPRNLELAARFRAGMQKAGASMAGAPTVQLRLAVTMNGGLEPAGPAAPPGRAFSWVGGGVDRQFPDQTRIRRPGWNTPPMTVQLRAELRPSQAEPVAWVATLQCAMQGDDEQQLAYEIGTLIGGTIGRRVDQTSF